MSKGWKYESGRHACAARGIRTRGISGSTPTHRIMTEKDAFELAAGGGIFPKEFSDAVRSQWYIRKEKFTYSHYNPEEEEKVEQKIRELKREWKHEGFKVKTKRIGFEDLARASMVIVMGIAPKSETITPAERSEALRIISESYNAMEDQYHSEGDQDII